tara:strand:- start:3654 stop:4553 length:900 start_codon:yes stop_codon:yes gene_type:complete
MNSFHDPVLLQESITGLDIKPNGVYIDVTFGGGGHSKQILNVLLNGKLIAFDQDSEAVRNTIKADSRFTMIHDNFRHIKKALAKRNIISIDGLIADLGVSSYQFSDNNRGFSLKYDAPLDMRMNNKVSKDGVFILNNYNQSELNRIFKNHADFHSPNVISKPIMQARRFNKINTVQDLKDIFSNVSAIHNIKFLARIFQAIRIEVNQELEALKEMLGQSLELLNPSGRLVVISYHSLEDRLVKNFMKFGNFSGFHEKDFFGNLLTPFEIVTKKPITPTDLELNKNNRSRSAKLRICSKK